MWWDDSYFESLFVLPEQLEWIAPDVDLRIEKINTNNSTTPIGVERVALFKKL